MARREVNELFGGKGQTWDSVPLQAMQMQAPADTWVSSNPRLLKFFTFKALSRLFRDLGDLMMVLNSIIHCFNTIIFLPKMTSAEQRQMQVFWTSLLLIFGALFKKNNIKLQIQNKAQK